MNKFPLHNLTNLNDGERLYYIRCWFKENFICDNAGSKLNIYTHDGSRITFKDTQYNHAFTKENPTTKQREIDYVRLRSIHLIIETVNLIGNIISKTSLDNQHNKIRRWYLNVQTKHTVILEKTNRGEFIFISQYYIQADFEFRKMKNFINKP
jgi:hypothetical protein